MVGQHFGPVCPQKPSQTLQISTRGPIRWSQEEAGLGGSDQPAVQSSTSSGISDIDESKGTQSRLLVHSGTAGIGLLRYSGFYSVSICP